MKEKKINARVAVCKCPTNKRVFGIRLEERNSDWVRTWAFKIDEDKARREGFDKETVSGTLNLIPEYPGCPYCGTANIAQCGCGKLFCFTGKDTTLTCPWCGQTGEYHSTEKLNIQGGGF
jgi:hypothetical protein